MPIKTENKHRYPSNWKSIRAAILERAGHRCEQCGVPNRAWRMQGFEQWTFDPATADTPENCDSANLRALCQRCHLRYDIGHHQQTAYRSRRDGKAMGDLFDASP